MESISGNFCVDKKPATINWIEGRGREVIVSAKDPTCYYEKVLGSMISNHLKVNFSKIFSEVLRLAVLAA